MAVGPSAFMGPASPFSAPPISGVLTFGNQTTEVGQTDVQTRYLHLRCWAIRSYRTVIDHR
jgi:hypothetical protein